ncbi:hypothetical protein LCGC14_2990260, partial [marine sediment metagenome]
QTRILWITLLALSNRDGQVFAATNRLAKLANIPVNKCQQCLQKLLGPDPDSRTPDNEGRRIERIPGGWFILNHKLYRQKGRSIERKTYLREKKREQRERDKVRQQGCQQMSTSQPITDTDTDKTKGFSSSRRIKAQLFPLAGKVCSVSGCRMPAVYKDSSGAYDNFKCNEHLPAKVKEVYG